MLNIVSQPFCIFILLLNCFFIIIFKKWMGPVGIFYFSILIYFISFINYICLLYNNVISGSFIVLDLGRWFFSLDFIDSHLLFCFDNLCILLSIIVITLSIVAQFFGIEYMAREIFIQRLIYLLNLFSTSVLLLFCVYDYFLVLIAWELIGLFSFLLVNFYSLSIYTIKSSIKTFVYSRLSDMFIFLSFILFILLINSTDLSIIFLKTPFFLFHNTYILNSGISTISILTLSISLASCIKAAQFGFHVWLPDAMNAPTPASSLIHSSTLVIMGIYLIIRFNLLFELSIFSNYFLIIIGTLTIALGSLVSTFQTDIKKLVAFSTISQMGYLICGCGFLAYDETIVYLIMHAINKAFLFILVGYVVHFFNSNTDLRQMGGLYFYSIDITVILTSLCLNLSGLPYSSGFYSKEFLLFQLFDKSIFSFIIKSLLFVSFIFTPVYMFILLFSVNFNIKKNIYLNYVNLNFNKNYTIKLSNIDKKNEIFLSNYEINYILSKATSILLFVFWFVFNFSGDYLHIILNNIIYQFDSYFEKNFYNINFKYYYSINIYSYDFFNNLFWLIVLISVISFKFLLFNFFKNLKNYFKFIFIIDLIILIFIIFLII